MANSKNHNIQRNIHCKLVIFAAILLLIAALIYGQSIISNVSARPKITKGNIECKSKLNDPRFSGVVICCQDVYSDGVIIHNYCTTCYNTDPPSGCSPRCDTLAELCPDFPRLRGGATTGPLNLTNAQSGPINLPGGKNTGPPSTVDAPPTLNGTAGNPVLNGTTAMMSSDNPPGCSKQNPIPLNCTLNPFGKLSNTNALPSSNAGSNDRRNLTSTNGLHYPGAEVIGPLNNTNSASVHHHHKSTSSSSSSSNTNGTGH